MPDNKVNVTISFKAGDLSGLPAVDSFAQALEDARKEIQEAQKSGSLRGMTTGSQDLDAATRRLNLVASEANNVRKALADARLEMSRAAEGSDAFDEATAKVLRLEASLDSLTTTARGVPAALEATNQANAFNASRRGTEAAGQASSGFSAIAGAAGVVSPELAAILTAGSDITGGLEFVKALPDAIGKMGEAAAASTGLLGGFAKAGQQVASTILPGMSAGMAGFIGVALPFAAIAAALAAAFALVTSAVNKATEAAREQAEANTTEAARQNELNRLIEAGNTDEIARRAAEAQQAFDDASDAFLLTAENAEQAAHRQQQAAENVLRGTGEGGLLDIATAGGELSTFNQELERNIDTMEGAQAELEDYTAALQAAEEQAARNAAALAEFNNLRQQEDINREVQALIEAGSQEQLQARREQIANEIALIRQSLPAYQELAATNEAAAARAEELNTQLAYFEELDAALVASTGLVIEARNDEAEAQAAQLSALQASVQENIRITQMTRDASVEQVEQRQQAIADELAALQLILPELEALAATSEEAAAELDNTNQRIADLTRESARLGDEVAPEARRRQIEEGTEALVDAERNTQDRIRSIREQGNEALIDLENKRNEIISKAAADAEKAFRDLAKKINKAQGDENKRYMQGELKALEKFQQEESKAVQQANKDRLKLLKDLHNSLLDAEEDNDVIAFIRAQRAGEQALDEQKSEVDESTRARTEQYLQERRDALEAHNEKLAQIKESAVEEAEQFGARKEEAIKAATEDYQKQSQATRMRIEEQIKAEREALRQTQELIRQKFNLEKQAGMDAANSIKSGFLQAAAAVAQALAAAMRSCAGSGGAPKWDTGGMKGDKDVFDSKVSGGKGNTGSGNNTIGGGGGNKGKISARFSAEGSIALAGRQSMALFEASRSYDEGIIPLEKNRLQRAFGDAFGNNLRAGGAASNITVNVGGVNVGDNASITAADVTDAVHRGVFAGIEALHEARMLGGE